MDATTEVYFKDPVTGVADGVPVRMYLVDAAHAVANFPDQWRRTPWDGPEPPPEPKPERKRH
jgi:hypothetical protein